MLPSIPDDANKYSRGSLLVLAGSKRYFGAGVLAAQAAARTGAGYVTLATPGKEAAAAARSHLLSTPVFKAPQKDGAFDQDALSSILKSVKHYDAIVLGCGITVTKNTLEFVRSVIEHCLSNVTPLLLDADGLNALAEADDLCQKLAPFFVLTPHAGELKRLLETSDTATAGAFAKATSSVVVAKGPKTTITNGQNLVTLANATPALASAGTGDVLSGIIGSLLAQGMPAFEAAQTGVELHSLAGCLAAERQGVRSVIAEDVIKALPQAIKQAIQQAIQ